MDLKSALLSGEILILDGGMGTQLEQRGAVPGGLSNLLHPEVVLSVHKDYCDAGANILITNTLTMNRLNMETHKVIEDTKAVNIRGAELARKAAGEARYVLGDIGSTGQMLEPYGDYTEEEFYNTFKEQAGYLAEGGVDGFIIETMFDLREALCALKACKEVADLPILVSMTFNTLNNGGRTLMGDSASDCAKALQEAGATIIGSNCGDIGPEEMLEIVQNMRSLSDLRIAAQPNAGKPKIVDGKTIFDLEPEEFAEKTAACIKAGATILGGCCGTSPAHIAALSRKLKR